MAHVKNSTRNKRKYTDNRKAATDRNKASKKKRAELHAAYLVSRTVDLIGMPVRFRTAGQNKPSIGTVIDVVSKNSDDYPIGAQRNVGNYLKIRDSSGRLHIKSRHRVKPVKENNAV